MTIDGWMDEWTDGRTNIEENGMRKAYLLLAKVGVVDKRSGCLLYKISHVVKFILIINMRLCSCRIFRKVLFFIFLSGGIAVSQVSFFSYFSLMAV